MSQMAWKGFSLFSILDLVKNSFQSFNGNLLFIFYFRLDHHSKIPPWEKSMDELNPKVLNI